MTRIVLAESSGANPYAAQNAAVSARAGSHGEQLVVDAERLERGDEPVAPGRVVAGERRSWRELGHRPEASATRAAGRYHRPMTDRPDATDPTPRRTGPRFDWHPEPELIGYGDEAASRAAR